MLEHYRVDVCDLLKICAHTECHSDGVAEAYAYGIERGGPAEAITDVWAVYERPGLASHACAWLKSLMVSRNRDGCRSTAPLR